VFPAHHRCDSPAVDKESKPCWPVATQLEVVVEVHEPRLLQLVEQIAQASIVRKRADHDQGPFDSELVGREVQPLIDRGSR
jgi:hypothetical protein